MCHYTPDYTVHILIRVHVPFAPPSVSLGFYITPCMVTAWHFNDYYYKIFPTNEASVYQAKPISPVPYMYTVHAHTRPAPPIGYAKLYTFTGL